MRLLNGADLAEFVKERQAKQVRALRQAHGVYPKLAVIQTVDDPVIDKYVSLKQRYGADILIDVEHHKVAQAEALDLINLLNGDDTVQAIIVQLPLANVMQTDELVNAVLPEKDVDGLGEAAVLDPATPMAINWLLAGYNVDLKNKNILVIGQGRLVGAPLTKMWQQSGLTIHTADENTGNVPELVRDAQIIVSAAGVPGLITSDMIQPGAVIVDAATSSENGKLVGDVADDVRLREDITITPEKGGVGPLTVAALFDNVIRAATATSKN